MLLSAYSAAKEPSSNIPEAMISGMVSENVTISFAACAESLAIAFWYFAFNSLEMAARRKLLIDPPELEDDPEGELGEAQPPMPTIRSKDQNFRDRGKELKAENDTIE